MSTETPVRMTLDLPTNFSLMDTVISVDGHGCTIREFIQVNFNEARDSFWGDRNAAEMMTEMLQDLIAKGEHHTEMSAEATIKVIEWGEKP